MKNISSNLPPTWEMWIWSTSFLMGSLATLVANLITFQVFWNQRRNLRQTSFVLVNLALADLSVGLSEGCFAVENLLSSYMGKKPTEIGCLAVDVFSEGASLTFLGLMSLERMHAVFWPLRHRMTRPRSYIYAICTLWLFTTMTTVLFILSYVGLVNQIITIGLFVSIMAVIPISICVVYSRIWLHLRHIKKQSLRKHRSPTTNKLTKTLLIASFLSLAAWLPLGVALLVKFLCVGCLSSVNVTRLVYGGRILQYGNSLLNPVVYSLRIPEFKDKIIQQFCKQRRRKLRRTAPETACQVHALRSATPVLLSFTSSNSPLHLERSGVETCFTMTSNL